MQTSTLQGYSTVLPRALPQYVQEWVRSSRSADSSRRRNRTAFSSLLSSLTPLTPPNSLIVDLLELVGGHSWIGLDRLLTSLEKSGLFSSLRFPLPPIVRYLTFSPSLGHVKLSPLLYIILLNSIVSYLLAPLPPSSDCSSRSPESPTFPSLSSSASRPQIPLLALLVHTALPCSP